MSEIDERIGWMGHDHDEWENEAWTAGIGLNKGCLANVGVETNPMAKSSAPSADAVSLAAEIKELELIEKDQQKR